MTASAEDERAVGDRRARDAAEEQDLVEAVADQRQAEDRRPVAHASTRADRRAETFAPRDDSKKKERGQHHADAVERRAGQSRDARP